MAADLWKRAEVNRFDDQCTHRVVGYEHDRDCENGQKHHYGYFHGCVHGYVHDYFHDYDHGCVRDLLKFKAEKFRKNVYRTY